MQIHISENAEQEILTAFVALVDVLRMQAFATDLEAARGLTHQERLYANARATRTQFSTSPLTVQLMDRLAEPVRSTSSDDKRRKTILTVLNGGQDRGKSETRCSDTPTGTV